MIDYTFPTLLPPTLSLSFLKLQLTDTNKLSNKPSSALSLSLRWVFNIRQVQYPTLEEYSAKPTATAAYS
jgi:hypothetical protein